MRRRPPWTPRRQPCSPSRPRSPRCEAAIAQAAAALNQSQVNLEHTVITAPIDGLVISRNVDVGQTVAASMQAPTLFVLAADLTKMQVVANLDESDVGRIRPNQVVTFRVDAYPNDTFHGTVSQVRLEPKVQQNVVTYATVIDVPNNDLRLKPGMTANVNVEIATREQRPARVELGAPLPSVERGLRGTRPDAARAAGSWRHSWRWTPRRSGPGSPAVFCSGHRTPTPGQSASGRLPPTHSPWTRTVASRQRRTGRGACSSRRHAGAGSGVKGRIAGGDAECQAGVGRRGARRRRRCGSSD